MVFNLPLDWYITVSLIIGIVFPLVYWKVRRFDSKLIIPSVLILNLYLVLQDYTVQKITGDAVLIWQSPYWWISDFLSIAIILWSMILTFNYFLTRDPSASANEARVV